ncbi:hypothetical protein AGOR_G00204110 [Albula goreensis]|uniref:Pyrin domain-containing protein n=1 Tax=Albula goreensis TaxID=1534307 RepID=A0A8T3CSI6_9TELE|nr:hypothetical protein AGOR_G00204110 [Albula goreensis]
MARVAGLLASTLDELLADQLKRFRWNLTYDVPEGFRPIPKGKLENKDVPDTVDKMLDSYGEEGAVKVTLYVLMKTGQNDLAQKLEKDYRTSLSTQAPADLRLASLHSSATAEAGGNAADHNDQALSDLRSVPCHSIAAQTGASVAAPQLQGCNVAGNINVTLNIQPDNKETMQDQKASVSKDENITRAQQTLKADLKKRSSETGTSSEELQEGHTKQLYNNLGDSGAKLVFAELQSPNCKLQTLGLGCCNLTEGCCDDLASVLRSPHSELRDLELRDNELQDSGVTALSAGLEDPHCKLQRLGLSGCQVTERGCDSLASALRSNPSHLRELDLSYNHPGDSGVRALSAAKLDTLALLVDHGGESRNKPGPRKYGCQLTLDPNTVNKYLSLSEGNRKISLSATRSAIQHQGQRWPLEDLWCKWTGRMAQRWALVLLPGLSDAILNLSKRLQLCLGCGKFTASLLFSIAPGNGTP